MRNENVLDNEVFFKLKKKNWGNEPFVKVIGQSYVNMTGNSRTSETNRSTQMKTTMNGKQNWLRDKVKKHENKIIYKALIYVSRCVYTYVYIYIHQK